MNLDRAILKKYTKYPFTDGSTLNLVDGYQFPSHMVLSFNLQVAVPGRFYIQKILLIDLVSIQITIKSSKNDTNRFTIHPGFMFGLIHNLNLCPVGSVLYKPLLYSSLRSFLTVSDNIITLSKNILLIMPLCITVMPVSGCQAILINQDIIATDVELCFKRNAVCDKDTHIISIFGDLLFLNTTYNPILKVNIHNLSLSYTLSTIDRLLLIKPAALSDLRVRTATNKILLLGVSDV